MMDNNIILKNNEKLLVKFNESRKSKKVNIERIGETRIMNCGEEATIVDYDTNKNILIIFKNTSELVECTYDNFKKGNVKSHFKIKFYKDKNSELLPSYECWKAMLARCYNEKYQKRYPTYKGCKVCDEWLNFKNFVNWYDKNYYKIEGQKMCLDKDILIKGNKVYSPKTCIFVPQNINLLFTKSNSVRGIYPIGVTFYKPSMKFKACCKLNGENKHLGYYNSQEEAFNVYKSHKEKYIKEVADEYKDKIPNKLYEAMYRYEVEITD